MKYLIIVALILLTIAAMLEIRFNGSDGIAKTDWFVFYVLAKTFISSVGIVSMISILIN